MKYPPSDNLILGHYQHGKERVAVSLTQADRRRHMYVLGQTGSGKTTFLYSMIMQDVLMGRGLCVLDPHGDLAESVVDGIPKRRTRDVVYLNPSNLDYPVAFNPLADIPVTQRAAAASNIIASLRSIWRDSWGPRMEHILANTLALLLEQPDGAGVSFLSIAPVLTNGVYRRQLLRNCQDKIVREFWVGEFAAYSARQQSEYVAPILNKVAAFSRSPALRNVIGQARNGFSLQDVMDNKKILVVNLAKGLLTENDTNLLGSLLVCAIQQEVMRRAHQLENERQDFHLFIDEFQNFGTDAFDSIVSEARKYRLSLVCANQYADQIRPDILSAVLGNMGTLALFGLSGADAERFAIEFHPFTATALREVRGVGRMTLKWQFEGTSCGPLYVEALFGDVSCSSNNKIKRHSSRQHGNSRRGVELVINRYLKRVAQVK